MSSSLLFFIVAQGVALACPSQPGQLERTDLAALEAMRKLDTVSFALRLARSRYLLGCLEEPLAPEQALAHHEVEAMDALLQQDEARARWALAGALTIQPELELDPNDLHGNTWLPTRLEEAREEEPTWTPVALPRGYSLLVDGSPADARPESAAALLQVVSSDGEAVLSDYLLPGEALDLSALDSPRRAATRRVALATGALSLTAGGLWVATAVHLDQTQDAIRKLERGKVPDGISTPMDLEALAARTNRLGQAAQASSGLALGLGATTLALRLSW